MTNRFARVEFKFRHKEPFLVRSTRVASYKSKGLDTALLSRCAGQVNGECIQLANFRERRWDLHFRYAISVYRA